MAPATCDACGKGGHKLLRCGRCRGVWFCNRECQVAASRQGHSGANCRPADGARTLTVAEAAPRVPDAAGPSTTAVDSASLVPAASSCHACGKNDAKLLRCGRCLGVWFCNRECQDVARKELGHRGANCRPANGTQKPASLANARSPLAAPSRPSKATDVASLCQRFSDLSTEGYQVLLANTRIGYLAAVENAKEAASVADLIGGAEGAGRRTGRPTSRPLPAQLGNHGRCRACRMLLTSGGACGGEQDAPGQIPDCVRQRGVSRAGRDGQI